MFFELKTIIIKMKIVKRWKYLMSIDRIKCHITFYQKMAVLQHWACQLLLNTEEEDKDGSHRGGSIKARELANYAPTAA